MGVSELILRVDLVRARNGQRQGHLYTAEPIWIKLGVMMQGPRDKGFFCCNLLLGPSGIWRDTHPMGLVNQQKTLF